MNTDEPFFDPEDPALTAYALGELTDSAERVAVEQTLQCSPEARAALREIRALTTLLTAEYEQERLLATAAPSNVVTMTPAAPRSGRAWPRRLLLAAAVLLLTATVAGMVWGPRWSASIHRPGAVFALTGPLESAKDRKSKTLPTAQTTPYPAATKHADSVSAVAAAKPMPMVAAVDNQISLRGTVSTPPADLLNATAPPTASVGGLALDAAPAPPAAGPLAEDVHDQRPSSAVTTLALASQPRRPAVFDEGTLATARSKAAAPADSSSLEKLKDVTLDANRPNAYAFSGGEIRTKGPSVTRLIQRRDGSSESGTAASGTVMSATVSGAIVSADASGPGDNIKGFAPGLSYNESDRAEVRRPWSAQQEILPPNSPNTAVYEHLADNPFLAAKDNPLSTFSIDVDTASYANVRRFIESGRLPPPDAVRIEELVNYFPYHYAPPAPGDEQHPFAVHLEAAACPWNPQDRLVRIGIKGRELARDQRPPSSLVFLLDVSGSMEPPERLPLIKASMRLLVEQLGEDDRVAIVTYAGESGIALPSTTGDHKERILRVLDALHAGGSTNGAAGIKLAYQVAREGFIKGGTNRVILATDGDFNVGVTNRDDLVRLIETEAKSGVFLSALGVGTDNYKDATMQKLADKGNGNYAYIDRLDEARKVLVEQMSGTLVTIAKDVKIQVEFNPATVAAYRLIGYEKRMLRKEDFNDDRVDAGEIGAGHSVTALYEVVPAGQPLPQTPPAVDALKYDHVPAPVADFTPVPPSGETRRADGAAASRELLTVKMRHKAPDGDKSERSYEESLTDHGTPDDFAKASPDFKFAAAVASFGLVLRDSPYKGAATLGAAIELARDNRGDDPGEYRAGFVELMRRARDIKGGHED